MYLSKHKSGYYYIYFNDLYYGRRRSISTRAKLKSDAIKFLSRFEKEFKNRMNHKVIPISIKDFANGFIIYSASRHTYKTSKNYKSTFNLLEQYFGNIPLADLSPFKMTTYIEHRIKSSSPYSAKRDLINLSSAFNKAVDDNYLLANPCNNIKRIRLPEKQPKFFSESEYKILLSTIQDEPFKFLVEIAVNTGLRQMELITLRWEQVYFKEGFITLNNHNHITKGKKIRSIPLNLKALQILNELEISKIETVKKFV